MSGCNPPGLAAQESLHGLTLRCGACEPAPSRQPLFRAIEGQSTGSIPEIEGLDPDTRKKLEEAITILRGLSKQVPGLP